MAAIPFGTRVIGFSEEATKTNAKSVCAYTNPLCQGSAIFLLPRTAVTILIFVEGRRKKNVIDSKQNFFFNLKEYSSYSL